MFEFTANSITVKGKTFPAEYSVTPSGSVFVFVTMEGKDEKTRICFNVDHEHHAAALAAARPAPAAAPAPADERPANIPAGYTATVTDAGNIIAVQRNENTDAAPAAEPEPVPAPAPADPAPVVAETPAAIVEAPAAEAAPDPDGKDKRGQVPEKTFIGESITGKGWKILFDGETQRTRIIFDGKPTEAARAVLDKAGFFFSAAMDSWNKKLTFKAYRAAQAVSVELNALYA